MKFLVIYFLVGGQWIAGDFVYPNGWSHMDFESEKRCEAAKEKANIMFDNSKFKGIAKAICQEKAPRVESRRKRSVK